MCICVRLAPVMCRMKYLCHATSDTCNTCTKHALAHDVWQVSTWFERAVRGIAILGIIVSQLDFVPNGRPFLYLIKKYGMQTSDTWIEQLAGDRCIQKREDHALHCSGMMQSNVVTKVGE